MLSYAVIYIAVFIFTCERYNAMDNQPLQSFGDHFFQQIVDFDNVKEPHSGPQRESDVLEERERVGKEENKENCPLKQKYSPCSSYDIKRNRRPFTKRELDEIGSLFVNHLFESDHEFSDTKEDFKTNTNTDMYDFKFKKPAVYGKFKQDNRGNRTKICDEEFVQSPSRHHKETLNGFVTMPFYKHNSCKTVQKNKNERCIAVNLYPENKIPQQYDYIAFLSDDDKFVNVPALRFNVFSERNRRTDNFSPFFVSTYKKGSHRLHDLEKLKCQHCTYVPILFINTIPDTLKKLSKRSPKNMYLRRADLLIENIKTSLKMQTHDAETPKFVDGAVLVNSRFKQKKDIGKDLHSTFTYQNQKQGHAMQNFPFKNLVDSVKLRHDKMVKKEISTDLSKLANASVNNKQNTEESGSAPPKQSDDLLTSFRFSNETFKDLEEIPNENFTSTVVTQITAQKTTETLSFPTKIEETNAPEESKAVPVEENNLSEAFQFPNLKTFQKIKSAFKNWMSPGSESTSVGAKYLKDTTIIASTTSVVSETSSETISSLTTSEMQSSISEVTEILPSLSTFTTSSKSAETKQSVKLTSLAQLLIPTHVTYTSSSYQPNAYQEKKPQMDHPYGTPPNYGTNEYQANNPQMDHPYGSPPNYGTNEYQENNPQKYHPNGESSNYGTNEYQANNPQMYHPYSQPPNYGTNEYQNYNPQTYYPYGQPPLYGTNEYQENNPQIYPPYEHVPTYRPNEYQENSPYYNAPPYSSNEYQENYQPQLYPPYYHEPNGANDYQENNAQIYPPYYNEPTYNPNEYQGINPQGYPPYYHIPNEYQENNAQLYPPYYQVSTFSTIKYQSISPPVYSSHKYVPTERTDKYQENNKYHVPTYSTNEYQENGPQLYPPYDQEPNYSANEYQENNPHLYPPYYQVPNYGTNEYQENNPQLYPPYYQEQNAHLYPPSQNPYTEVPTLSTKKYQKNMPKNRVSTHRTNEYQENNPQVYPPYYQAPSPNGYQEYNPQLYPPYYQVPNYGTNEYQENNPQLYPPYYQEQNAHLYPPAHNLYTEVPTTSTEKYQKNKPKSRVSTLRTNEYQENNPQLYPPYYQAPSPNGYQEYNPQLYPPYYQVPNYGTNEYQENNPQLYPPYYQEQNAHLYPPAHNLYTEVPTTSTKKYQKNKPKNRVSTLRTNEYQENNPQLYPPYYQAPSPNGYQEYNPQLYPPYYQVPNYGTNEYQENNPQLYPPYYQEQNAHLYPPAHNPYTQVPTTSTKKYQKNKPKSRVSTLRTNEYQENNPQVYPPYYQAPNPTGYQEYNPQLYPPYYQVPNYGTNEYQEYNPQLYPPYYQEQNAHLYPPAHNPYTEVPTNSTKEKEINKPKNRVSTHRTNEYQENNPQLYPPYYQVPSPNGYQEYNPQLYPPYYQIPNYGTNEYQEYNPQLYPPYYQEQNAHLYPPYKEVPTYSTKKYQQNNPKNRVSTHRTNEYQEHNPQVYPPYNQTPSPNGYQEYNPQIYPPYYQVPTYSPNGYQENNPYGYRPYDEKTKEYQQNNPPNKDQRNKHPISTFRTNTDEKNKPKEHNPYGPISTYGTSEYETNIPTVKSPNFQTNIKDNSPKVTPAPDRYGPSTYRSENFKEGSSNEFGNYRDDDLSGILDLLGHDLDSDNIHTSDTREQGILEKIKSKLRILSKDLKLMMVIQNLLSKSKERSKKQIRRIKKFVPFSTRLRSKRRKITASRNEKVKKGKRLRHVLQRRKRRLVKKRKKGKT